MNVLNLVGFVLPPVIDVINRRIEDRDVRFWVAAFFCAVVGMALNVVEHGGHFGPVEDVAGDVMVVFGQAQLMYKGLWEHSAPREKFELKASKNEHLN